jgi:hypothetical protein
MVDEIIRKHGFVYVEETLSPDGATKVIYGYSEGEKSPLIIEPRVIDVATGEVLLDLWHLRFVGYVMFEGSNKLRVRVDDPQRQVTVCEAEVNVKEKTYTIPKASRGPEPLTTFRQRMHELSGR